jgi:hypothetical protein
MEARPGNLCVIHPVGDPLSGQCVSHEVYAFAPPEPPKERADPSARPPWFLSGAQTLETDADTGRLRAPAESLCMLERFGTNMFRSRCHADQGAFELPQLEGMLASRKLVPASPAAICQRTEELTFDPASGRFRCAGRVTDPCHSALSVVLPEAGSEPAAPTFACRRSNAQVNLANPCPPGTWLLQTQDATNPVFSCVNPCPQGQIPKADGNGAHVCDAESATP